MPDDQPAPEDIFNAFFLEVGILAQLSRAMFDLRLPPGISVSQVTVLNHLVRVRDGRTPLELARAFQVPKTSMTHSLAVLERQGFIRLAPNPADGRSKCTFITAEGRAFRLAAIDALTPDIRALAARFPASRLAGVLPTLTELRRIMDALRDDPPPDQT
jgi:DNA-binding MarR family transcriptional regulator